MINVTSNKINLRICICHSVLLKADRSRNEITIRGQSGREGYDNNLDTVESGDLKGMGT